MFSTLRNRFGIPGVISVIALVFAMFGGAYAASNSGDGNATASAKKKAKKKAKKGPRGPRGATGPAGPAGAQGPAGPAGAKGDNGANGAAGDSGATGAAGATGANGTSVTSTPEAPGPNCTNGGVKFTSSSGSAFACNGANGAAGAAGAPGAPGADGSPWTLGGTLPDGATLTGTISHTQDAGDPEIGSLVSISFPIPLDAPLDGSKVHHLGEPTFGEVCTGNAGEPTAPSGHLCLYSFFATNAWTTLAIQKSDLSGLGAGISGAVLVAGDGVTPETGSGTLVGTWAVTG